MSIEFLAAVGVEWTRSRYDWSASDTLVVPPATLTWRVRSVASRLSDERVESTNADGRNTSFSRADGFAKILSDPVTMYSSTVFSTHGLHASTSRKLSFHAHLAV